MRRLASEARERVWGSKNTEPWHPNGSGLAIGEIWFPVSDAAPLLVKILLTRQHVSVQVHPDDDYAREHGAARGKTEMWHVLTAEPNAQVAVGLRSAVTEKELRRSLDDGSIVDLLRWVPARAGDTFLIPAGTIHAIGAGLTLCEIQQFSEVTYRMFDFGRGREIHIENAVEVSRLEPGECRSEAVALGDGRDLLAECAYFRSERVSVTGTVTCPAREKDSVFVVVSGEGEIDGEAFRAGQAWEVAGTELVEIQSSDAVFIVTSES